MAAALGRPPLTTSANDPTKTQSFGWLAATKPPDFCSDDLAALLGLFLEVLVMCRRAGRVKLRHVALDDTKVRANVSKHRAMSWWRMKDKEDQLEAELLRRPQAADEE